MTTFVLLTVKVSTVQWLVFIYTTRFHLYRANTKRKMLKLTCPYSLPHSLIHHHGV